MYMWDIRRENILYSSQSNEAYLIDFDFAKPVRNITPWVYNRRNVPERHIGAKGGGVMNKLHDRYGLQIALQLSHSFMSAKERDVISKLSDTLLLHGSFPVVCTDGSSIATASGKLTTRSGRP